MVLSARSIHHDASDRHHQAAQRTPLPTVARALEQVLSSRLTAIVGNLDSTELISAWADDDISVRSPEAERRLRAAYEIVLRLRDEESDDVIRAWFMGMNPVLHDQSPLLAISNGDLDDAVEAALAFAADAVGA